MLHQSKCGMRQRMPVTMHVRTLSGHMQEPNLDDIGRQLNSELDTYIQELVSMENKPKPKAKAKPKRKGTKKKAPKKGKGSNKKKSSKKKAPKNKMAGGAVRAGSVQNFVQK